MGEFLTRATIWIALAGYTVSFCLQMRGAKTRGAMTAWLLGAAAFAVHAMCAFHFFYGWSHSFAIAETARQTKELTGFDSGSGLYLNYLFGILWVADAVWWLRVGDRYLSRPRWLTLSLHGFFWFMIVNGAIVFGSGAVRYYGVSLMGLMLVAIRRSSRRLSAHRRSGSVES